jgi:hypothetical protein
MAYAGVACLSASAVIGFVARRRETWFDRVVPTVARQFVPRMERSSISWAARRTGHTVPT